VPKGSGDNDHRNPRNDRPSDHLEQAASPEERSPQQALQPVQRSRAQVREAPDRHDGYFAWRVDLDEPTNDAATGFIQRPGMSSAIRFYARNAKGEYPLIGNWLYDMVNSGQVTVA